MTADTSAWLIIAGSLIFALLGTIHLIYTFVGSRLKPRDAAIEQAMQSGRLNLTRETTVWRAWIGFNASHSLGAMLPAAVYVPLCLNHFDIISASLWLQGLPLGFGLCYLVLARRYWFSIPLIGISLATLCFAAALILIQSD